MQLHPYLFFNGRCDEALAFYGKALDAEIVDLMRYKDAPADAGQGSSSAECPSSSGRLEKVMHATVRIGDTIWQVRGPDLPAGSRITVTGTDGTMLVVARTEG